MAKKLFYVSLHALVILIIWSCNKATDLTAILDGPDPLDIRSDDIAFKTRTIPGDSIITYNDSALIPSHFTGSVDDPVFGISDAFLSFQLGIFTEPDLTGASLDSVVLSLEYDTTRKQYGALNAPVSFEVFELTGDLSTSSNYYSSSTVEYNPEPIGEVEGLIPNFKDTLFIPEPQSIRIDTVAYRPHLRIPLRRIGQDLIQFTEQDFASVEIFIKKFKGLTLRPSSSCEGMVFFRMLSGLSRINLYYTRNDTSRLIQFPVLEGRTVLFNTYQHQITGTPVEAAYNNPAENDSILYLQSMQGPDLLIEISDLSALQNSMINFAQLELNLAIPTEADTAIYKPITQMIIQELKENGSREDIIDLRLAGGNQLTDFFGGNLQLDEDSEIYSYKFNITRHLQKILDGTSGNKMIVSNIFKGAQPNRSILYGKSSHALSARIKVTYSNSN